MFTFDLQYETLSTPQEPSRFACMPKSIALVTRRRVGGQRWRAHHLLHPITKETAGNVAVQDVIAK